MNTASILEQVVSSILVVIILAAWDLLRKRHKNRQEQQRQQPLSQPAAPEAALPQTIQQPVPSVETQQLTTSAASPHTTQQPAPHAAFPQTIQRPPPATVGAPVTLGQIVSGCLTAVWIVIRMGLSALFGFVFGGLTSGMLVAFDYPYSTEMGSPTMIILVLGFTIGTWVVITLLGKLAQMIFQMYIRPLFS
jgi:ABC-type nickel/cobalt efflux system permease component RcnA